MTEKQTPEIKWMSHSLHPQHQLKQVFKNTNFRCDLCRAYGEGLRQQCVSGCDFVLHDSCSTLPATLPNHFFAHRQSHHSLHLNTVKPNLLSFHKCHLCRHFIRGAAYECKPCRIFLHPLCSRLPETVSGHDLHPTHPLTLEQPSESSPCDVCDEKCKRWRYCCRACGVHIHIECLAKGIDAVRREKEGEEKTVFAVLGLVLKSVNAVSGIAANS